MELVRVTTNLLDMRAKPSHDAERVNQALFDDLLSVSTMRTGFARVSKSDGYQGWVDQRFLVPVSGSARAKQARVTSRQARVSKTHSGRRAYPHVLFYGTSVRVSGRASGGWSQIVDPTGGELFLRSSCITTVRSRPVRADRVAAVIKEATKFLGVPYLWGGITSSGCDCSGLVQTVFATVGIKLPRDTKDQATTGNSIEPESISQGDLLFFDLHVAIAIDQFRLIHSSRGSGGVAIESLLPGHDNYRVDLHTHFLQARRIL